jgi:transglutaminase-like putative cysteine protease
MIQKAAGTVALLILIGGAAIAQTPPPPQEPQAQPPAPTGKVERFAPSAVRNVSFTYTTEIAPNPSGQQLEVWIPLPRNDSYQRVGNISVQAPIQHEIVDQGRFRNRVVHLVGAVSRVKPLKITIRSEITRREQIADFSQAELPQPEPSDGAFAPFLRADRLVPIDGKIAVVSASIGSNNASPLEQARALYDYVILIMKYDKTGEGWGRGDALYACDVRKGNCTDFHSLFIALARARGIPARFVMGFPLGNPGGGEIGGYHCWAEFFSGGVWVPVDASEAWKNPARHNYYFGRLDADRVAFTMGRDLELKPPARGEPVNFLIYPYAEMDGAPLAKEAVKNKFEYRDLQMADSGE